MEPLPESTQADDWFGPFTLDDRDLLPHLRDLGRAVVRLVPHCIGLSVSLVHEGVTFTVAASTTVVRLLDAAQYAADGPCLAAERTASVLSWHGADVEEEWHLFSLASAAAGVASTLSLPIVRGGAVTGGFNLYASTRTAFDGHHDGVATLLGAWVGGATTNADLGFLTRELARDAPRLLRNSTRLAAASARLARVLECAPSVAEDRLVQAARQADVPLATLVDGILDLWHHDGA